jgi:asparagine synthase (glutamine-hydrolysing)
MCGIAGIIELRGEPANGPLVSRMNHIQRHRGPDGEGVYAHGPVAFGHRRLAIIDPEGGHQPLVDDEAGLALTYNGEIYNYREIRAELAGLPFHTDSDTEVVLRAYQKWGMACLERFRGMFAFALHDRNLGKVFLARDRLGIKPLHYRIGDGRLVFASELTPVAAVAGNDLEIDPEAVAAYLHFQYIPTPSTIYRGVRKLEPATWMEVDLSSGAAPRSHRYWTLAPQPRAWDDARGVEELEGLLDDIIRLYVRSDVPFGAFLSGGIDSSVVTAAMSRQLPAPVQTFTIGYREEALSELPWAAQAARRLGTNHQERIVSSEMGLDMLERILWHVGEPFGDSSAVPTYYVSEAAASEVKMVLSGDGGDEILAGYHSYPQLYDMFNFGGSPSLGQRLRGMFRRGKTQASLQQAHDLRRQVFGVDDIHQLMGRSGWRPETVRLYPAARDPFQQLQFQDLTTYMLDDILTKVDRMSMAASLEVRVPLLDHVLVEYAFSLPLTARIRRLPGIAEPVGKVALKLLAGRTFGPDFVHRRKMGFGIPVTEWLKGPLRPVVLDLLDSSSNPVFQLLDRERARQVVTDFEMGTRHGAASVWSLMMLLLWGERVHGRQGRLLATES